MKKLLLLLLMAGNAFAAPLIIVTTSGPGSLSDQVARYIQPLLSKELSVEVIVLNAPGANGVIGLREFSQTSGDHVLIGSFAVPYVAKVNPQKEFNPVKDFVPVVGLTHAPMHILVPASSPVKDAQGLIAKFKADGSLRGGSAHPSADISMALLDKTLGTTTQTINYRQLSQLYMDLAAGRIDYAFGGATSSAAALLQSGQLRSLGRLDQLGVPDFSWTALFVKTGNENGKAAIAAQKVITFKNMAGLSQPFFSADSQKLQQMLRSEYELIPANN